MLRSEFDNLLEEFNKVNNMKVAGPSDEAYRLIEFVYNYHPCNLDKSAVAGLYADFGMTLFYDMEARAKEAMELEQQIQKRRSYIKDLNNGLNALENELKTLGDKRYIDND